jgi:hypothetical protein
MHAAQLLLLDRVYWSCVYTDDPLAVGLLPH